MNDPTPTRLRCSSLPLVSVCAASLDPEAPLDRDSPEARLGTALHYAIARRIEETPCGIESLAARHRVSFDELAVLDVLAAQCWRSLSHWFPSPTTEATLSHHGPVWSLTGTADVLSTVDEPEDGMGEVRILDWKSGRADGDHESQLRGYAYLALLATPWADRASAVLVRVRDRTADWSHWSRVELSEWFEGLTTRLDLTAFNPGRHCANCRRLATCPAATGFLVQASAFVQASALVRETHASDLTPADLGLLFDGIKALETCCDTARDLIRARVTAAGGTLPTGDGRALQLLDTTRRTIDYAAGRDVLLDALGDDLAAVLQVNRSAAEAAIKATAPPRGKGKAVAAFMDRLDAAGAIHTDTITRLEIRRANANAAEPALVGEAADHGRDGAPRPGDGCRAGEAG